MHELLQTLYHDMFHLPLPLAEKILRPVIVYLCLIVFLRLFGKRELAQLNPFDLVVLLSLSNTVQNAIIGDDNSVTGGIDWGVCAAGDQLGSDVGAVPFAEDEPGAGGRAVDADQEGVSDEAAMKRSR